MSSEDDFFAAEDEAPFEFEAKVAEVIEEAPAAEPEEVLVEDTAVPAASASKKKISQKEAAKSAPAPQVAPTPSPVKKTAPVSSSQPRPSMQISLSDKFK